MGILEVSEQLKAHCPCLSDSSPSELDSISESLIQLLSSSACWERNLCETILTSLRTERFRVPCSDKGCGSKIERYTPYYQGNIDFDSVEIYIIDEDGLNITRTLVPDNHFTVTDNKGFVEFLVDLDCYAPSCKCCDTKTYIEFNYMAGYEAIPNCILSEACELVKTITASRMGCGDLTQCNELSHTELGHVLKSKRKGELSWTWTQDQTSIEFLYNQLVIANRFKTLGLISLCGTNTLSHQQSIWAISSS